jgi:hypothetical protein
MSPEYKLNSFREGLITASMYWGVVLPEYTCPGESWFVGWLRRVSLEQFMTILDDMARRNRRRPFDGPEHLGKCISIAVRNLAEGDPTRAIYFD